MRERQDLDKRITMIRDLEQSIADNTELIEMGESEGDQSIVSDAEKALMALKPKVAETEIETLLSGEADSLDAFVQINAGAGNDTITGSAGDDVIQKEIREGEYPQRKTAGDAEQGAKGKDEQ